MAGLVPAISLHCGGFAATRGNRERGVARRLRRCLPRGRSGAEAFGDFVAPAPGGGDHAGATGAAVDDLGVEVGVQHDGGFDAVQGFFEGVVFAPGARVDAELVAEHGALPVRRGAGRFWVMQFGRLFPARR